MCRAASHVAEANDDEAVRLASMAKYFWAEMSVDVTDDVLQIHGGAGYVTDHRAEGFYCDE